MKRHGGLRSHQRTVRLSLKALLVGDHGTKVMWERDHSFMAVIIGGLVSMSFLQDWRSWADAVAVNREESVSSSTVALMT